MSEAVSCSLAVPSSQSVLTPKRQPLLPLPLVMQHSCLLPTPHWPLSLLYHLPLSCTAAVCRLASDLTAATHDCTTTPIATANRHWCPFILRPAHQHQLYTHLLVPPRHSALQVHAPHEGVTQLRLGQVRGEGLRLAVGRWAVEGMQVGAWCHGKTSQWPEGLLLLVVGVRAPHIQVYFRLWKRLVHESPGRWHGSAGRRREAGG